MNSLTSFFNQFTLGKKIMLSLTPLLSIFLSMKEILFGLWILILIDLLTGIRKSLYIKKIKFNIFKKSFWISIKSYLLRKTWQKTYEYTIGIVSIVVLENLVLGQTNVEIMGKVFTISQLFVVVPACIEVWSIYENFEAVSGNNILKKIKEYLLDSKLLSFIKKSKKPE